MKRVILVFGEGLNDTRSVAGLAKTLHTGLADIDILPRRDPIIHLKKGDLPKTRRRVSDAIVRSVKAESVRRKVISVLAHQDADAVEPAHEAVAESIEFELTQLAVHQPIGVVPAWELEAWLMLFPNALRKTRACWRIIDLKGRNTGKIVDAKEALRRALRPVGKNSCPDYVESDSVSVVQHIATDNEDMDNIFLRSASLRRFRDKLYELQLE